MLNIAYVGFGKSTNRYHIPYVRQRPDKFHISRVVAPALINVLKSGRLLKNRDNFFNGYPRYYN